MGATAAKTRVPIKGETRFRLTAVPEAAAEARTLVDETLIGWALHFLIEDAKLIVSELVANSIAATPGGEIGLLLTRERNALWICVRDSSPALPEMRACAPDSESGRGLHIVAAIAEENGAFRVVEPQGKITWARLKI
jgi:anti-sigma regulatory factor (Ser/Thr protein kinase)